jgi:hypothetical protein
MSDEEKIDLKAIGKRLQTEFGVEKAPLTDAMRDRLEALRQRELKPLWPDAMRKDHRRGS